MKLQSVFQNAVEPNSFLIQLDEKSRLTMNSVFTSFSLLQHVPQEKEISMGEIYSIGELVVRKKKFVLEYYCLPESNCLRDHGNQSLFTLSK